MGFKPRALGETRRYVPMSERSDPTPLTFVLRPDGLETKKRHHRYLQTMADTDPNCPIEYVRLGSHVLRVENLVGPDDKPIETPRFADGNVPPEFFDYFGEKIRSEVDLVIRGLIELTGEDAKNSESPAESPQG